MALTTKLTGRTRHRAQSTGWWGGRTLLVLQVEKHTKGYAVLDARGNGHEVDSLTWHDAQVEDMYALTEAEQERQESSRLAVLRSMRMPGGD